MMFTKSINLVLLLLLLTPQYNFAKSDSDVHKNNNTSTLKYNVLYSVAIVSVFLTIFFYIEDRRDKRRNSNAAAAAAAATAEGLKQSAAALQLLPVFVYSDFEKSSHAAENKECAICITEFQDKDKMVLLPCGHAYHPYCVGTWFITKVTCPLCRSDIKSELGVVHCSIS